jgi:hypothetical protein
LLLLLLLLLLLVTRWAELCLLDHRRIGARAHVLRVELLAAKKSAW